MAKRLLSDLALGTSVYAKRNGTKTRLLVVHKTDSYTYLVTGGIWRLSFNMCDYATALSYQPHEEMDSDFQAACADSYCGVSHKNLGISSTISPSRYGRDHTVLSYLEAGSSISWPRNNLSSAYSLLSYAGSIGSNGYYSEICIIDDQGGFRTLPGTPDSGENFRWIQMSARPLFKMSSNAFVDDDDMVVANNAPSKPSYISASNVVDSIYLMAGQATTISWSAGTDPDGDTVSYVVEARTSSSGSWSQIFSGTNRSTSYTVPTTATEMTFRVKSVDSYGMESGYTSSISYTVTANTAPTTPSSITVPNTIATGTNFTVSWTASTDAEGNLAGYQLQRKIGSGSWGVIYAGSNRAYVDNLASGVTSVRYRVRAYDTYNAYSGFVTSSTRTVVTTSPPVITCSYADGASLGTKTAAFTVSYSVNDADGDTVTVKEYLDGVQIASKTPTLGASQTYSVDATRFLKCLNGTHTIKLEATDGTVTTTYTLTFVKAVPSCSVTLTDLIETTSLVAYVKIKMNGSVPSDATVECLVSNNANDTTPVWEDATTAFLNGTSHAFTNATAANGYAFGYKVTITEGQSGEGGYINSIYGGYHYA